MKQLFILLFAAFNVAFFSTAFAQVDDYDYEKYQVDDSRQLTSSVAWHPTQKNLCAIANTQGYPIYLYNTQTRKIERKIDIKGYYAGPNITWSADGKFLLLEQKFYLDYSPNKDRPLQYEVMDVASGQMILKVEKVHAACFSFSGNQLYVLKDEQVKVFELPSGKSVQSFSVPGATTGIAMGAKEGELLISHHPTTKDLLQIPSIANNKKAIKPAVKYRSLISVFNAKSGKRVQLIPEIYDMVYSMKTEKDKVFVYAKPHAKLNPGAGNGGYINQISLPNYQPIYTSFQTNYIEPDYKQNADGSLFGCISISGGKRPRPNLILYNSEDGSIQHQFAPNFPLHQKLAAQEFNDGRAYFLFLDNNEEVLLFHGNQICQWKFK